MARKLVPGLEGLYGIAAGRGEVGSGPKIQIAEIHETVKYEIKIYGTRIYGTRIYGTDVARTPKAKLSYSPADPITL
jgi:hypothetical protein